MVYFVCESCNETLKKAQVDRHLYSCKNCWGVTCVDCNFTFEGDSFREHTSCVSEEQKYQGALFKAPKAKQKNRGVNEIWADAVSLAASNAATGVAPKPLCHHLIRMGDLGNVPRQEKKFKNFVKNSLRVFDDGSVSKLWEYMDGVKNDIARAEKAAEPPAVAVAVEEVLPAAAAAVEEDEEEAGVEQKPAAKTKKSKKSKKRARAKAGEAGEKSEDANGVGGTEKRPRGEGKQVKEGEQEHKQEPGEGEAGAADGGGDVDAATRKALAKAAIGIVKKAPNKRIAVKELAKQTAAVVLAARKNEGNAEGSGSGERQLPDERRLRRALKQRLQEKGSGGLKRVSVTGKVAVYITEAQQS